MENGKYLNLILEDFYEREQVRCYENICPALRSGREGLKVISKSKGDKRKMEEEKTEKKTKYRIRKLTPLETWRLQNFSDDDFRKAESVNSNSQLYKQSGNSICVAVLCAIFSQLGIQNHKKWNSMSLEERRQLVYKGTVLEAK